MATQTQKSENDIVLLEVPTHQRRLEYVMRLNGRLVLSYNWCPISLLTEKINVDGWRITKVGDTISNPDYMQGNTVAYLEEGDETDDGIWKLPIIDEKTKNKIIKKLMEDTATQIITFYKGQTDGFPHVRESRWENDHLIVWLDPDYIREFCGILPYAYFDRQIKCFLCYDGQICIPEFEEIFEYFGINPEDVEPKI